MSTSDKQCINNCTTSAGLTYGSSAPASAKIANTTFFKVNGRKMYVAGAEVSLVGATLNLPTLNGVAQTAGNLAFDDGTVPDTTLSCRIYAIVATSAENGAGTVTLSAIAGADFPKNRNAQAGDFPEVMKSNQVIIGWIYLKNETSAVFVPGTTALNGVSGMTYSFTSNYGISGK